MKGQILNFSLQESRGVITGDDGKRYEFAAGEWKENCTPERGMTVDFDVNAEQKAIGVYLALQQSALTAATSNNTGSKSDSGELSLFQYATYAFTKKYATFSGRARRKEYWGYMLFWHIVFIVLEIFGQICSAISEGLGMLVGALVIIFLFATSCPSFAVTVRRLHDIGRSGWWVLLQLFTIIAMSIGFAFIFYYIDHYNSGSSGAVGVFFILIAIVSSIAFLIFLCKDSVGDNKYGSNPKNIS